MRLKAALTLVLVIAGVWQTASGMYIPAKAWLAQVLIERAWDRSLADGTPVEPWPWADTTPLAKLTSSTGESLVVLSGASGEALAFGPAHVNASAAPGSGGHVVIGGHRDTHFRFLKNVVEDDLLELETRDGKLQQFYVDSIDVVDITRQPLILLEGEAVLTLITCYPFSGVSSNTNTRYVVTARQVGSQSVLAHRR